MTQLTLPAAAEAPQAPQSATLARAIEHNTVAKKGGCTEVLGNHPKQLKHNPLRGCCRVQQATSSNSSNAPRSQGCFAANRLVAVHF